MLFRTVNQLILVCEMANRKLLTTEQARDLCFGNFDDCSSSVSSLSISSDDEVDDVLCSSSSEEEFRQPGPSAMLRG